MSVPNAQMISFLAICSTPGLQRCGSLSKVDDEGRSFKIPPDEGFGGERHREHIRVAAVLRRKQEAGRHAGGIATARDLHAAPVEDVAEHSVAERLDIGAEERLLV